MKIFVTGHRGYIGSHLVNVLKREGHAVVGCDLGLFEGCNWEPMVDPDVELVKDVRAVEAEDLDGCDCVMHLAAISNDPMGELNAQLTFDINRDASIRLARIAKRAGVPRFLFAGSCSIYGKGEKLDLDEGDPLNPLTAYAKSKIETERAVSELADATFSPAYLRNATAYGHSPMLRIDLVVNNLLASAMAYGEIRIQSDGSPWRPLIHCRDIARAFAAFAAAPREAIHDQAINVGGNTRELPGARRRRPGPAADPLRQGRLHRRGRRRPAELPGQLRQALPPPARLPPPVQPGQRHGGTPPQDGRARLQQEGLRRRPVRPPPHPQGAIRPPQFIARAIMIFTETPLKGAYLIDLEKRGDDRGFFARAFCEREFAEHGLVDRFVQANNSLIGPQGDAAGHALPARPQGRDQDGALRPRVALRRDPRPARRARRPSARASAPSCRPRTGG